eukprot:3871791-Pleurochrysis_carterae.AAC.1
MPLREATYRLVRCARRTATLHHAHARLMATAADAHIGVSTGGAGERAVAAATHAVRCAGGPVMARLVSPHPPARTQTTLRRWTWLGGIAMERSGRDVARRATRQEEETILINVQRVEGGELEAVPATQLLALSNGVLSGVLAGLARGDGDVGAVLRVEGVPAAL